MPPRLRRLSFTRGVALSVKSTALATSAMAPLECGVASSNGASSNVAPQHVPLAVDSTLPSRSSGPWGLGDPSRLAPKFFLPQKSCWIFLLPAQHSALLQRRGHYVQCSTSVQHSLRC